MNSKSINMVKLCVGAEKVLDLYEWQNRNKTILQKDENRFYARHVTRMKPKRETELLNGGSLYWVFKGHILARQNILSLNDIYFDDQIKRCEIKLDKNIMLTESKPKRAFQGWRYLETSESPKDLKIFSLDSSELPRSLMIGLAQLGVL